MDIFDSVRRRYSAYLNRHTLYTINFSNYAIDFAHQHFHHKAFFLSFWYALKWTFSVLFFGLGVVEFICFVLTKQASNFGDSCFTISRENFYGVLAAVNLSLISSIYIDQKNYKYKSLNVTKEIFGYLLVGVIGFSVFCRCASLIYPDFICYASIFIAFGCLILTVFEKTRMSYYEIIFDHIIKRKFNV